MLCDLDGSDVGQRDREIEFWHNPRKVQTNQLTGYAKLMHCLINDVEQSLAQLNIPAHHTTIVDHMALDDTPVQRGAQCIAGTERLEMHYVSRS
jgi:hypothetical protein